MKKLLLLAIGATLLIQAAPSRAEEEAVSYQAVPFYAKDGKILYWDCGGSCGKDMTCCSVFPWNG